MCLVAVELFPLAQGSIEQSAADRLDMILKVAEQLQKSGKAESTKGLAGCRASPFESC